MTRRSGSTGAQPAPNPNPNADTTQSVPGYRDLARIGHGGFSVVYRAVQESFERAVALKVLNVGPDEDARRRFLREVRLASRLSGHPHVVTVLDTGTTASGSPYLAMDLYDGGSMKDRLRRQGPLSPAETAMVGAKIADALAAAHSLGVVHRDVTPNNILISRFGEPALADFGVSWLLDSNASASVLDVFSPQHAAPELITRGVPTAASDVYALGSTLYQLLTGRPPFGAEGRDVRSVMWRVVSEPPPRPQCPDLPELADAIVRAMAKEPQARFADAAEFARTLRALIPDGTPSTLPMPEISHTARTAHAADTPAATSVVAASALEDGADADVTPRKAADHDQTGSYRTGPYQAGFDQTMLRPDRADPEHHAKPDRGRHDGAEPGRVRRARKPLILAAILALLGAGTWAVVALTGSPSGARDTASTQRSPVTAAAYAGPTLSSAHPTASVTPTPKRSTAPAAVIDTAKPTTASAGRTAGAAPTDSNTSGPLLSLPGTYHRLRSVRSGTCLVQSGGSAAAAACAPSKSEGWEYSLSLARLLSPGDYALVNKQSGSCLAAGSNGQVIVQTCDGGSAQVWSKVSGPDSSEEFQNVGDGKCLQASTAAVSLGSCGTGDRANLWTEDGTV